MEGGSCDRCERKGVLSDAARQRRLDRTQGRSGATRHVTAAAVVVGSFVMLFDPILQGLAIAMMFGAVVATGLTLLIVPLLYFEFFGRE